MTSESLSLQDIIDRDLCYAEAILTLLGNDWDGRDDGGNYTTPSHYIYEVLGCVEMLISEVRVTTAELGEKFVRTPRPPADARDRPYHGRIGVGPAPRPG